MKFLFPNSLVMQNYVRFLSFSLVGEKCGLYSFLLENDLLLFNLYVGLPAYMYVRVHFP